MNIIFQNKNEAINNPFVIWNKTTIIEFNDQKYFIEFPMSFEKRFIIWDLLTILWNKLIGALNNLFNKVICIFLLKVISAYTIK